MSASRPAANEPEPGLRHVLVAGGEPHEWAAFTDDQWRARLDDLGKVADHAGATWLTVRPYGPDTSPVGAPQPQHGPPPSSVGVRSLVTGGCTVVTSPGSDGRQRLVGALRSVHQVGAPITESSIASRLNAPAPFDPDLVVILGAPHRLPPSLVWELGYSELVFVDVPWSQLQASHLEDAVASFMKRHRRFGGLD